MKKTVFERSGQCRLEQVSSNGCRVGWTAGAQRDSVAVGNLRRASQCFCVRLQHLAFAAVGIKLQRWVDSQHSDTQPVCNRAAWRADVSKSDGGCGHISLHRYFCRSRRLIERFPIDRSNRQTLLPRVAKSVSQQFALDILFVVCCACILHRPLRFPVVPFQVGLHSNWNSLLHFQIVLQNVMLYILSPFLVVLETLGLCDMA